MCWSCTRVAFWPMAALTRSVRTRRFRRFIAGAQNEPERPLLDLQGLSGGYGDVTVVQRCVAVWFIAGQAACVTGRNGVGKSTLRQADRGAACRRCPARSVFDGEDITSLPDHGIAGPAASATRHRKALCLTRLSILENLTLQYPDRDLCPLCGPFQGVSANRGAPDTTRRHAVRRRKEAVVVLPCDGGGHASGRSR